MKITVKNMAETQKFAETIAKILLAGDVLLLEGDLGAGKTTFTQGLGQGLGVVEPVKSPTYTLIREYQSGRLPLYHMDVYRLENGGGDELGLDEYFDGDGVCVVEWAHLIQEDLPEAFLRINLARVNSEIEDEGIREIALEPVGEHYEQLVAEIEKEWQNS